MKTRIAVVALALAARLIVPAGAPAPARAEAPPSVEPKAAQLLAAALGKVAGAKNLTFRAEITNDTPLPSGEKIQFSGTLEAAVRRPNGLWSRFEGEQRRSQLWYDGKTLTLLNPEKNLYASCAVPDRLEELFPTMKEKLGFTPPLSLLLHEDVAKEALARVRSGFTVGRGVVRGVSCRHLAFRGERIDWQIWIAEEGEPTICRIVITYKQQEGAPQYTATFLDWNFAATPDDARFAFAPPPGAAQCDFQEAKP